MSVYGLNFQHGSMRKILAASTSKPELYHAYGGA